MALLFPGLLISRWYEVIFLYRQEKGWQRKEILQDFQAFFPGINHFLLK